MNTFKNLNIGKIAFVFATLFLVTLTSCSENQVEDNNSSEASETTAIIIQKLHDTVSGTLLNRSATNSTSTGDDVDQRLEFDFCFNFMYPITLTYNNGTDVVVTDSVQLATIAASITSTQYINGIVFPFDIETTSGIVTINNETDFQSSINSCDTDNDGIPNHEDTDDDNDGIIDTHEDVDGDGNELNDDTDGDNIPNCQDTDDDGDGVDTADEDLDGDGDPTNDDTDGDGIPNCQDTDDDGDGVDTADEDNDHDGSSSNDDSDGDGTPDYLDTDSDNDGIHDGDDNDADGDGVDDDQEGGNDNDGEGNEDDNDGEDDGDNG